LIYTERSTASSTIPLSKLKRRFGGAGVLLLEADVVEAFDALHPDDVDTPLCDNFPTETDGVGVTGSNGKTGAPTFAIGELLSTSVSRKSSNFLALFHPLETASPPT
jgi:UDP-N-acetylmuramyl pentapeptide synthase